LINKKLASCLAKREQKALENPLEKTTNFAGLLNRYIKKPHSLLENAVFMKNNQIIKR
jgi:hypothetical protein